MWESRPLTEAEKNMCKAVMEDEQADESLKTTAELMLDGTLKVLKGQTAADKIRNVINEDIMEGAYEYSYASGNDMNDAIANASVPAYGSNDNYGVPEAVLKFEQDPSSFETVSQEPETSTGKEPIDKSTYDLAKNADVEKFETGSYQVSIRKVAPGTKCYNQLEDTHYTTDEDRCYIVTGTCGEEWPINAAKLESKYHMHPDGLRFLNSPRKINVRGGGNEIYAFRADGQHDVQTSWGDTLKANRDGVEHGSGDMIVSDTPDFSGDVWVVNGKAFDSTYQPAGTAKRIRAEQRKKDLEIKRKRAEEFRKVDEEYQKRVKEQRKQMEENRKRNEEMIAKNPHSDYARPDVMTCRLNTDTDIEKAGITQDFKDKAIEQWKNEHDGQEPTKKDDIKFYRPVVKFHDDTWVMHDASNAKDYEWETARIDGLTENATLDRNEALQAAFDFVTDEDNEEQIRYGAPYTAKDGERKRYDRKNHETMVYVGGYTRMRFGKAEQVGGYWKSTGKWLD